MKFFTIAIVFFLLFPLGQSVFGYRYLKTLVQEHRLVELAASPFWLRHFPAEVTGTVPALADYFEDNFDTETAKQLPPAEVSQQLNALREQWLQEFYPPPTEAQVLEVLSRDDNAELRAHMVAFMMAQALVQENKLQIPLQAVYLKSFGVAMVIRAIDREDMEGKELQELLNNFVTSNTLEVSYVGDGETPYVPARDAIRYNGREDYLLHSNHVKHPLLSSEVMSMLWQRGYTKAPLTALFPPQIATMLINQMVLLDPAGKISGYDPAFLTDLLCEPCIIGDFLPSVYQAEAISLDEIVATELGMETDSDGFTAVIALLNAKDNPAGLFQIVQLVRLGYTLEEITALDYYTRDAIIVSGYYDRAALLEVFATDKGELDILELNKIVAATGPLTLFLMQQGYVDSVAAVKPHHTPSHTDMQLARQENEQWIFQTQGGTMTVAVQAQGD